jgi:hypothetical protein
MHTGAVIMTIGVHGARNATSLLATPVPDECHPGRKPWPHGSSGGTMSASQIEISAGSALARARRQPAPASLGIG